MSTVFTSFRLPALFALATAGTIGFAQEPQPPVDPQEQQAPATGGWRRVTDPPPATARNTAPPQEDPTPAPTANEGGYRPLDAYGQGREAGEARVHRGMVPARGRPITPVRHRNSNGDVP